MKKFILPLFLASALAASAQTFVTGADVGYLLDDEESYYSARFGLVLKANETFSHSLDAEVGYTNNSVGIGGGESSILPVTLNYRLSSITTGNFGYYVGAGLGAARVRADGVSFSGPVTLRDTAFAAQGFTGLTWQATPAVTLNVGAKYIWIDEVTLASSEFEVGDDVVLSAGISIKF